MSAVVTSCASVPTVGWSDHDHLRHRAVMSRAITLVRCAVVAGYAGLSCWLTAGGPTELGLWVLTLTGSLSVAYVLAADWIAAGARRD